MQASNAMTSNTNFATTPLDAMQLEDYGKLQERYQAMTLSPRAQAVLKDAETALRTADRILSNLSSNPKIEEAFERIRKNSVITAKMRPSEAKNMLMDPSNDFLDVSRHKLAVWRKTMERISQGEGILFDHHKQEYISSHVPLAMAIASASTVSMYLSTIQLVYGELSKIDPDGSHKYSIDAAKVRRCSTFLSDCENAASFTDVVH
ncbi:MAG: hypothetical protein ACN2B6_04085 [Rickettsiales bacterium]